MKKAVKLKRFMISIISLMIVFGTAITAVAVKTQGKKTSVLAFPTVGVTTVHYYNSYNWDNVSLYYYQNGISTPQWPGVDMTHEKGNWFLYKITGIASPKVIFSNKGVSQDPGVNQEGYSVSGEMWYKNGKWYTKDPSKNEKQIKVHFYNYNNWKNVNIYYTDGEETPVSWPGAAMTPTGDGWYEYEISSVNNPNVVFSNNGSDRIPSQDQDGLTVTKESWFRNGKMYDSRPLDTVVHFCNPEGWSAPSIYYYSTVNDTGPRWPGSSMTDEGNGWYKYNISKYSKAYVLFNDGVHQMPASGESGISAQYMVWIKDGKSYYYDPDTMDSNTTVGDINGDGLIDEYDHVLLNGYIEKIVELTAKQLQLADTNNDGKVDKADLKLMADYINGIITHFPIDSDTDSSTESDIVSDTDTASDTDTDSGTDSEIVSDTDTETDTDTDTDSSTDTDTNIDSDTDTDTDSDIELKSKNASYVYDKLGRVTKVIYDENNYVEYSYDKNGNITDVNVVGNVGQ